MTTVFILNYLSTKDTGNNNNNNSNNNNNNNK